MENVGQKTGFVNKKGGNIFPLTSSDFKCLAEPLTPTPLPTDVGRGKYLYGDSAELSPSVAKRPSPASKILIYMRALKING